MFLRYILKLTGNREKSIIKRRYQEEQDNLKKIRK